MSRFPLLASAVALALLTISSALAQEAGPLDFAYGYNVFALDDTTALVEIDYQYTERGLTYERVDGERLGRLRVRFSAWDSTGRPLIESSWITTNEPPKPDDEPHALLGVKLFGIRPGNHRARIAFEDVAAPQRRDSADFKLTVRSFPTNRIALSDVEILSEITQSSDETNRFYKNGYIIYPNVLSAIDPPFLLLNTYLEIYNANLAPTSQYEVVYGLADAKGKLLYQKEEKRDRPTGSAVVDVHSLVLDELPSGSYFLLVKAFAGLHGSASDSAMVVRPFTLSNPDKDTMLATANTATPGGNGAAAVVDAEYLGMSEPELDKEFHMLKYLSVERDREIWGQLSGADAKARFLAEFWAARDPDRSTAANELRDDYRKRIEQANQLYRETGVDEGYQTDRGRILLQYGRPDQIDRHYFDKNRRPYEVWTFSRDNYQFVFVDRSGMGRFQLVHSDAPGEKHQEDWERRFATIHEYLDN